MKLFLIGATAFAVSLAQPAAAHARQHHHHRHHHPHQARHHGHRTHRTYAGGRPAAWCGWYMRGVMHVGDPAYNLARNWAHWGQHSSAHVGAIVVWPHHVGRIVGGPDPQGRWLINSGNDGHQVRTRYRSVRGAIAFRVASS